MKIKIQEKETVVVVSPEGNIMQEDVTIFRSRLEDLIHKGRIKIVLDMSGVIYLSSMCLAVIIDIRNKLGAKHGDLKLASANSLIKNLFEITRLIRKIAIHATLEDAIAAF
jgi:anti-sigma B factor antagonist